MQGIVVYPGKEFDNFAKTGKKVTATFEIQEAGEKIQVRVNANNTASPKADFLRALRRGDLVELVKEKERGDIKAFYDIDTWAIIASGGGGGGEAPKKAGGKSFNDDFADSLKRAKWFQDQGIKLAEEVWLGHFGYNHVERDLHTIFERGGKLGTSLHMDMIAKGHR